MARLSLSSLRPFLVVCLSTVLVSTLALGGCSSAPKTVKKPVVVPTTTAVTKPPPPPFTAKGMPADLAAVIRPLYLGGAARSSPTADKVLRRRKPVDAAGPVVVTSVVAVWKGVPIAVVTKGKDVTLAVKAPRWKVVGGWWPSMAVPKPSLGAVPRRVLVVGSDARPGEPVDRSRGDSLHIVGFDGHGGGGVLGIARDSYVPRATGGQGKVNSALTFGGPSGLQRTVTSATGVPLEGYLITGFDGFQQLIAGIGGLSVRVPTAVQDSFAGANIKAGVNRLNGGQALAYRRARHGVATGDFGRSENQGRMITAAAGMAKLAGPTRLPAILRSAAPRIGTNLSAEQVLTFVAGVYITSPAKIHNRVATGGLGWTADRQSIVLLDANARRLFARYPRWQPVVIVAVEAAATTGAAT